MQLLKSQGSVRSEENSSYLFLIFLGGCQAAVQSPSELVPDKGDLDCSIQHALVWGSGVTKLNFIKNGTEEVMNCDEEEMRAIFPLTTESCT